MLENIYSSEYFLNQSVKGLPQISGLRIWYPSRKSGNEMNLKRFLYLVLLDSRVKQIYLLERFWKSFTFLV